MMGATASFIFLSTLQICLGDIYIHNPRGSNNRLDENTRARNNNNRLFDSQNNNRGGYNVGGLYYYAGSKLNIEWTNQHSCGDNTNCEVVIQYMCDDKLRDGTTTTSNKVNNEDCYNNDCETDTRYGMHESKSYYDNCRYRTRNYNLFSSSQNLQGKTAIYTRQNNNGGRSGYECPEERDYYPYWHPTPWKDLAILTNNVTRCKFYQEHSQNIKGKNECQLSEERYNDLLNSTNNPSKNGFIPNNRDDCVTVGGRWVEVSPHNTAVPVCQYSRWSRDNHLGNGRNGFPVGWNWTIPEDFHEQCTLRVRYNISTNDYDGWRVDSSFNPDKSGGAVTSLGIHELYNATVEQNYVLKNNPTVDAGYGFDMELAINTAQYGRTFQDRSHMFAIRQRSDDIPPEAPMHNINVKGKRGNIVQVFPSVEYDFTPNRETITEGTYVHFQWVGSDSNPNNNDGQGRQGTDRSNIVILSPPTYDVESDDTTVKTYGHLGNNIPGLHDTPFLGFSANERINLARVGAISGDLEELDDAPVYFDMSPRKITTLGVFHYMCTRNNNFSNRSQKGKIVSTKDEVNVKDLDAQGGSFSLGDISVTFPQDALIDLSTVYVKISNIDDLNEQRKIDNAASVFPITSVVSMGPEEIFFAKDGKFILNIEFPSETRSPELRFSKTPSGAFHTVDSADLENSNAFLETNSIGYYAVFSDYDDTPLIIATTISLFVVTLIYGALIAIMFAKR